MNRRAILALLAMVLLLLITPLLSSCAGPGYLAQAVSGHVNLMRSRQDIDHYIEAAAADDPTAERLQLAKALLEYASTYLHLPADENYQTYAPTAKDAVTWNVVVTPEFSLQARTWCFPVAGCVPYRGYFEKSKAERFANKMASRGLDVSLTRATAYSTLGWFEDPILTTMLSGSSARLASILFHELAHQRLYLPGDTTFNESYATFVAQQGVRRWMTENGDRDGLDAWEVHQQRNADFIRLLSDSRAELAERYARGGDPQNLRTDKEAIFAELETRYRQVVATQWNGVDPYQGWFERPPNNADLALTVSYNSGQCGFHQLWSEAQEDFDRFHALAAQVADLNDDERSAFLLRQCPAEQNPP